MTKTNLDMFGYPDPAHECDKDECWQAIEFFLDTGVPTAAQAYAERLKEIIAFEVEVLTCGKA